MLKKLIAKLATSKIAKYLSDKHLWVSAFFGASLVFAYAPFSFWWLTWLVLPFWLFFVAQSLKNLTFTPRYLFKHGFAFGLGWFGAGISWVHVSIAEFGGMPLVASIAVMILLCAYLAIYPALALYLTAKLSRWRQQAPNRLTINWWLLAPCWTLAEYLRGFLLTGFPWLSIGYTQIDAPSAVLAPIVGEFGISFVIVLVTSAALSIIYARHRILSATFIACVVISIIASHGSQWVQPTGQYKKVALIQGNIAQAIKWQPEQQWPTMLKYLDLSRQHYDADIIVWPESAIPAIETMSTTQEFLDIANQSATLNNAAIITGIINYNFETKEYFNSLIVLGKKNSDDKQGNYFYNHPNRYDKNHLLPIGEFVPFADLLRPIAPLFNLPMSSFTRGPYVQRNLMAHDAELLSLICFEIAFPQQLSANLTDNTDMILTVSNDAWFGNSHGPHQHMEIARMRALEFGRPLLRATNTGITATTDHLGTITNILPQFEQGVLVANIVLVSGNTPYSKFGNGPIVLLAVLLTLFSLIKRIKP